MAAKVAIFGRLGRNNSYNISGGQNILYVVLLIAYWITDCKQFDWQKKVEQTISLP